MGGNPSDPGEYLVSFPLPTIPALGKNVGNFLSTEDEFEVMPTPKPNRKEIDPETKLPKDGKGWPATLVDPGELQGHTGTHLMRCRRFF